MTRFLATLALATAFATLAAAAAAADHGTVPGSTAPWSGGDAAVTPLETLAARIASHIAGHEVHVHCETATTFRSIGGGDNAGFVLTAVDRRTNRYAETADTIELTSQTCGPLQRFAEAAVKPTRCSSGGRLVPCFVGARVAPGETRAVCADGSCFSVVGSADGYWRAYGAYASALGTLAHEAMHTRQAFAGAARPPDHLVEAEAECWGLQWLPWVARQFGDSAADAQSIATFSWLVEYPQMRSTLETRRPYWSQECRPGGKLDIRAPGAAVWP